MSGFIPGVSAGGSLPSAFGVINVGGTVDADYASSNIDSVSNPSTGQFVIDFTSAGFSSTPFILCYTIGGGDFALRYATSDESATGITVTWLDPNTGSPTDTAFSLLVLGA